MRRKSERNKATSGSPEKVPTRKITRRGRRPSSQSSDVERQATQKSDEENEVSERESSSEREVKETIKTRKRSSRGNKSQVLDVPKEERSTRSRRTKKSSLLTEIVLEEKDSTCENGDSENEDRSNDDSTKESQLNNRRSTSKDSRKSRSKSIDQLSQNNSESNADELILEITKSPILDSINEPQMKISNKSEDLDTQISLNSSERESSNDQVSQNISDKESSPIPIHSDNNSHSNNHRSDYRNKKHRRRSNSGSSTSSSDIDGRKQPSPSPQKSGQLTENRRKINRFSSPPRNIDMKIGGNKNSELGMKNTKESARRGNMDKSSMDTEYDSISAAFRKSPEPSSSMRITYKTSNEQRNYNDSATKMAEKPKRRRKWLTQKSTESKPQVLAISTDSLRNIISDVKPVPLSDVKLESSPEPEVITIDIEEKQSKQKTKSTREKEQRSSRREREDRQQSIEATSKSDELIPLKENRKISIVHDTPIKIQKPPSPPKNSASNILFITNLVRPFTVLQLKGLLARTGRIVENGFWIDKIKSKCYVKYETEDEAVETRHALHGVRWPSSNPKCLNVDFGSIGAMGKAIASTEEPSRAGHTIREERVSGGWNRFELEDRREPLANRPIREWDLGKKEELIRSDRDRDREKETHGARIKDRVERERERERDRDHEHSHRGKDAERTSTNTATTAAAAAAAGDGRRRRSMDRIRRSPSLSPPRKFQRKENDPPIRLLDDLFRKTKATPCIYWLPLTPDQIAVREEARRKQLAEHKRRMEEKEKEREREREREKEREREREKDREKDRERDRDRNKERRDRSSERRKDPSSRNSKARDGDRDRERDRDRRRF